jgi:hypothetical protein
MNTLKPLKPSKQNVSEGISKANFKPANIGITAPKLDLMGGASSAPAAKAVRKANRAGIVGRKISLR